MELSIGEMMLIAVAIVVLFGPDKLPKIARDLGQGVRKMRGAMEDVKSETAYLASCIFRTLIDYDAYIERLFRQTYKF